MVQVWPVAPVRPVLALPQPARPALVRPVQLVRAPSLVPELGLARVRVCQSRKMNAWPGSQQLVLPVPAAERQPARPVLALPQQARLVLVPAVVGLVLQ